MQEEDFPSRTLEPTRFRYLNLMKCVWILQRIKWSSYYLVMPSDSLWKYYFREMEEVCVSLGLSWIQATSNLIKARKDLFDRIQSLLTRGAIENKAACT